MASDNPSAFDTCRNRLCFLLFNTTSSASAKPPFVVVSVFVGVQLTDKSPSGE
jgi:hypothetical protein